MIGLLQAEPDDEYEQKKRRKKRRKSRPMTRKEKRQGIKIAKEDLAALEAERQMIESQPNYSIKTSSGPPIQREWLTVKVEQ